jgi:hypothetical protein
MAFLATTRPYSSNDVGTLWMMRQVTHIARCALVARTSDWELRVIVDGDTLLAERCERGSEAFALADEWKRRMLDDGWHQVVPSQRPAAPGAPRSSAG